MNNQTSGPHPYHDTTDKNSTQKLLDWLVPVGLLVFYFTFYNFGKVSTTEMIKTTGLVAIALLSITLAIGPLSRFIPRLNILKVHRKFWGIASFLFAVMHGSLVLLFDQIESSDVPGIAIGISALLIISIVTISSNQRVLHRLHPGVWKKLQMMSYIVLTFAVTHFYLMEQKDGVLVIKRSLGKVTYWFAAVVILVRLLVFLFPKKDISKQS